MIETVRKKGKKSILHFPKHYLCFWKETINNVLMGEAASCSKCIQGWAKQTDFWETRERERDITEKSMLTVKPAVKGCNALSGSRAKWILSSLQPGLTSPYQEDSWCPPDQEVRLSMTQKQREEAAWVSLIHGVAVFSILVHYNKMKSIFRAPMASWWSDCPVYI